MSTLTRRSLREHILKLLYLREFHDNNEFDDQFDLYIENFTSIENEEDTAELKERFVSVVSHLDEIDRTIEKAASNWKFNRIGKIELMVLRIALFEILYDDEVPNKVAVNEAVELSKIYGSDDMSYGFVNGVLGSIIKE